MEKMLISDFEKLALRYKAMRFLINSEVVCHDMKRNEKIATIYDMINNAQYEDERLIMPIPVLFDYDPYTFISYYATDFEYRNGRAVVLGYLKTESNNYIGISEGI